jgi:hypothetical protein
MGALHENGEIEAGGAASNADDPHGFSPLGRRPIKGARGGAGPPSSASSLQWTLRQIISSLK